MHRSVRHTPVNLKATLERLTQMLQTHCAHESTTRVGVEHKETEARQSFRLSMLREKNVRFGVDGGNEEGDIEGSVLNSTELEL